MERDFLVYAVDLCIGRWIVGKRFSGVCSRFVYRETGIFETAFHVYAADLCTGRLMFGKRFSGVCSRFVYRETDVWKVIFRCMQQVCV